jgi:hypothetical protein
VTPTSNRLILVLAVLAAGVWIGFVLGFSKSMRKAATRMQSRSNRPLYGRLLIGAGCVCFVVAVGATFFSWNFIRTARKTTGTVIEMREQTDKESGGKSYAPIFSFKDTAQREHRIESSFYAYPPLHRVGDTVPVLYQADAPDNARIDGFWDQWGVTALAGIFGVLLTVIGSVVLHWPWIAAKLGRSTAGA